MFWILTIFNPNYKYIQAITNHFFNLVEAGLLHFMQSNSQSEFYLSRRSCIREWTPQIRKHFSYSATFDNCCWKLSTEPNSPKEKLRSPNKVIFASNLTWTEMARKTAVLKMSLKIEVASFIWNASVCWDHFLFFIFLQIFSYSGDKLVMKSYNIVLSIIISLNNDKMEKLSRTKSVCFLLEQS